jgi:pimeloyl-ACP methyl ester carboxylesterase
MAADALGVLDALGIARAHICGASMGGMIAQHLAAQHPQRVRSLTLMMTTSGARHLPQPALRVRRALLSRPRGPDPAALAAHLAHVLQVIGSPAYPPDPVLLQQRLLATVRRSWHPQGTARQIVAVVADGDRSALLPRITAPTLVIHGAADPLVPAAAGRDLVARIAGARGDFVPGMGHDLPLQLLERFAEGVAENTRR